MAQSKGNMDHKYPSCNNGSNCPQSISINDSRTCLDHCKLDL